MQFGVLHTPYKNKRRFTHPTGEITMGMNLTLAFEVDVLGVAGRNVEAYDLCRGKTMDKLDAVAKQLGMTFLDDFPRKPDLKHLSNEQEVALLLDDWNEKQRGRSRQTSGTIPPKGWRSCG